MQAQGKALISGSGGLSNIQGIAVDILQDMFMEEGADGKPLYAENGCTYILNGDLIECNKTMAPPDKLWCPTIISAEDWQSAVVKIPAVPVLFRSTRCWNRFMETMLLPAIKDQWGFIYNVLTVDRIIHELERLGIKRNVIRWKKGVAYRFNEEGIYYSRPEPKPLMRWSDSSFRGIATAMFRKAFTSFEEGMSIEECLDVFLHTQSIRVPTHLTFMERFVGKIERPSYEREPENQNPLTFDRIRVEVCLSTTLFRSRDAFLSAIKKHREDISRMVLDKIENDKAFQKFGVPISVLRLSNLTLRSDHVIEYLFEIKDLSV